MLEKRIRSGKGHRSLSRLRSTAARTTVGGVVILVALALRAYLRLRTPEPVAPRRPVPRRRDPRKAAWTGAGGDIW